MYPGRHRLQIANSGEVKRWRQRRFGGFGRPAEDMSRFRPGPDTRIPSVARSRGRSIAARPGRVVEIDPSAYIVFPDTTRRKHLVTQDGEAWACSCDLAKELADERCEHVWAVVFTLKPPQTGEVVLELIGTVDDRSDSWRAYTEAQKAEGRLFSEFLSALLSTVDEPGRPEGRAGAPRLPLREGLFCTIKKVYSGFSCRRYYSEMEADASAGLINRLPNWSVASRFLSRPEITPLLLDLVTFSATPLMEVERGGTIAIDSTGFSAHWFGGYFLEAHDVDRDHDWVKAHLAIGARTHIVTAAVVNEHGGDAPEFPGLLHTTVDAGFAPSTVVADRGYLSHRNYAVAAKMGLKAYIPFKSNSDPTPRGVRMWRDMYHQFALHDGQFDDPYHQRSQVESTNSALKRKLGEPLLSKGVVARRNEVLCKILGYNITILIAEVFRSGIDPIELFRKGNAPAEDARSPRGLEEPAIAGCENIGAAVKESTPSE